MTTVLPLLCLAAFGAGFVDSVVGGGGLVQLPALFAVLPGAAVPSLLGTNKLSSIFGTTAAAITYGRKVETEPSVVWPAALLAFVFSYFGARVASLVSPDVFRPLMLLLLVALTLYTAFKKDFGGSVVPKTAGRRRSFYAGGIGAALGFYDGFFGPGTGSLLIFLFVGLLGLDFLRASAVSKVVNAATNLSALIYFAGTGHVLYAYALPMAACNVAGSFCGTHLAIARGNRFVRMVFLCVVGGLILKLTLDTLRGQH